MTVLVNPPKTASLRTCLIAIVLVAVLPVLIFSGVMIDRLAQSKLEMNERLLLKTAEELSHAFDEEVHASIRTLQAMSYSNHLQQGQLGVYHGIAKRILASQKTWRNILLSDLQGRRLLSARHEFGQPLGSVVDPESFAAVIETEEPVVGNIKPGPDGRRDSHAFAIRVPVHDKQGKMIYVLSAVLSLESTQSLVTRFSTIPGEWVRALIDGDGRLAARSREHEKYIGGLASKTLREQISQNKRGIQKTETLEGIQAFTGISQAPFSGWHAAVAVPQSVLVAQAQETRKASLWLGLILLTFSALATVFFSKRVTRSIRAGSGAAAALAQGQTPAMPDSRIAELHELRASLLSASELLRSRDKAKDEFLANMSHELRTPLGIVLGMTDLLAKDSIPLEEQPRMWEIVHRNGQHLRRLIDDILDFSKVEADRLVVEAVEFSLPDLIGAVVEDFSSMATKKGVQLKFETAAGNEDLVVTDPVRVRQVVSNLVGNAVKFTESGSVIVRLHPRHAGQIRITVQDTGIGLSPEQQGQLFREFTQGDNSHTRKFGGTGLGLSLSRKLARLLDGDVRLLESHSGGGCLFEFTFESKAASTIAQNNPSVVSSGGAGAVLPGSRILLAEDSQDNVALIKNYLKNTGTHLEVANNGADAVRLALSGFHDLILMDIQMPDMDGFTATLKIREAGIRTAVIALTAHALEEHRKRALASGFTEFLTKPLRKDQLLEVVSRHLRSSSENREQDLR